jgi:hypothetical protein
MASRGRPLSWRWVRRRDRDNSIDGDLSSRESSSLMPSAKIQTFPLSYHPIPHKSDQIGHQEHGNQMTAMEYRLEEFFYYLL